MKTISYKQIVNQQDFQHAKTNYDLFVQLIDKTFDLSITDVEKILSKIPDEEIYKKLWHKFIMFSAEPPIENYPDFDMHEISNYGDKHG